MNQKVTVYTKAYNTRPYLKQCIDSVLSQSYSNFEYILVDNGCTDGSSQILQDYAQRDKRIELISYDQNRRINLQELIKSRGTDSSYITVLDSDDWWEPNYLEQMIGLAMDTKADIVSTGTLMHPEGGGANSARRLEHRLVLNHPQYSEWLPHYHAFFRTVWAKLIRTQLYLAADFSKSEELKKSGITYGSDTICAFACLREAKRICLDNSVLHHYRIHKRSFSHKYDTKRFLSDVNLYNDAIRFLQNFGSVSTENQTFLQIVYANALIDTFRVIDGSNLSASEKLQEYERIVKHPLTMEIYQKNTHENIQTSRHFLLQLLLKTGVSLNSQENHHFQTIIQILLPQCGGKIHLKNLPLILKEHTLYKAFLKDNLDEMLHIILQFIEQKRYSKQYNLGEILHDLLPETSPLHTVTDSRFFHKHLIVCKLICEKNNMEALEQMTSQLLEENKIYAQEIFLDIYLSLAALENQIPAFLFGKIRLAKFYLETGRTQECRGVRDELEKMGMSGNEEFLEICEALIKQ